MGNWVPCPASMPQSNALAKSKDVCVLTSGVSSAKSELFKDTTDRLEDNLEIQEGENYGFKVIYISVWTLGKMYIFTIAWRLILLQ